MLGLKLNHVSGTAILSYSKITDAIHLGPNMHVLENKVTNDLDHGSVPMRSHTIDSTSADSLSVALLQTKFS